MDVTYIDFELAEYLSEEFWDVDEDNHAYRCWEVWDTETMFNFTVPVDSVFEDQEDYVIQQVCSYLEDDGMLQPNKYEVRGDFLQISIYDLDEQPLYRVTLV